MNQKGALSFELVLPCYNEEKSLERIVDRAIAAAISSGFNFESFNLILVENGSKDNSRRVCKEMLQNPLLSIWIKIVLINENVGYGNGIYEGLKVSSAPVIGWSHADEQCDPLDAFRAYNQLRSSGLNRVFVKGVRVGRSLKEKFVSRVFESIASLYLGRAFYEINAQPKVFSRELLKYTPRPPLDFSFDLYFFYMSLKHGFYQEAIEVEFLPRVHGFSSWAYGFKNRLKHIVNMVQYIKKLAGSEKES